MTSLFPHSSYAEDQPYAKLILLFHVLRAGLSVGSFIGISAATVTHLVLPLISKSPASRPVFSSRLLRYAGRGGIMGILVSEVMTFRIMQGKEEIEWQDRAWRLLENEGQKELDYWTLGGSSIGAILASLVAARRGNLRGMSRIGIGMGGAGVGSVIGTMKYPVGLLGGNMKTIKGEIKDL